jgi:hypothetical protein
MGNEPGSLQAGDRVRLSGGYDMDPAWLSGRRSIHGTVVRFIPGQNATTAALIKLDAPIVVSEVKGDMVVLQLRYAGASWGTNETVHVELCDFTPEPVRWQARRKGEWVESHATYERITG